MKTAIITFDPERAADWDADAEARPLGWMLMAALNGREYPKGRGIESIEVQESMTVLPVKRQREGADQITQPVKP